MASKRVQVTYNPVVFFLPLLLPNLIVRNDVDEVCYSYTGHVYFSMGCIIYPFFFLIRTSSVGDFFLVSTWRTQWRYHSLC